MQDDRSRLEAFLAKHADGWTAIDELTELASEAELFTEEFLRAALEHAKKSYLRQIIRSLKGPDGFPLLVSVERIGSDGVKRRVYRQESLFDVDDYKQVVQFHAAQATHHRDMAAAYAQRCKNRFVVDPQMRLF